jgi:hypothetical protein
MKIVFLSGEPDGASKEKKNVGQTWVKEISGATLRN